MNTHRVARTATSKRTPTTRPHPGAATGWMLLCTALGFCGVAWLIIQWGTTATTVADARAQSTFLQSTPVGNTIPVIRENPQDTPIPYNPDPFGSLMTVLEQQGEGLALVGGSVLGGVILLLLTVRSMTRVPKAPLTIGLGRTLTLLENDQRAGNLTPQRALEVARQAVAEMEQAHEATIRARTQEYESAIRTRSREYEQATAHLTQSHTATVDALQAEATRAVQEAQAESRRATTEVASTLQRLTHTEAQVQQLSRDLATTHAQLVEATTLVRTQDAEIAELTQGLEEATDTLVEWQTAHKELRARHATLTEAHTTVQQSLQQAQETVREVNEQCERSQAEVQSFQTAQGILTQEKSLLTEQLKGATKELARLRGVSLRELPLVIPDREGDLAPHLASLVAFIRGTTLDTGAAGGERTSKPILSSWRDIRRLLQVLKGVGVRLAVPAHHLPKWVESGEMQNEVQLSGDSSNVQALTDSEKLAHNGKLSTDLNTSDADVPVLQPV